MMKPEVFENVKLFIEQFYPNPYGSIITGSHVENKQNEFSDIDVIVFVDNRRKVSNETLQYKGYKIQSIVIPIYNIDEVLWVDYITSKGAFLDMIEKGIIVHQTNKFPNNLISHTRRLKEIGPPIINERDHYFSRVKLTSQLHDLMGGKVNAEMHVIVANLVEGLTKFKLMAERNWCGDGKYRMRMLNSLHEGFASALGNAVKTFYKNDNKEPLIKIVRDTLNQNGGLVINYSKNDHCRTVSNDYLVLEISPKDLSKMRLKNVLKTISDFFSGITIENIQHYYFKYKPVGKNSAENNIYWVIHVYQDFLNNYLIDRLSDLFEDMGIVDYVNFPIQFDPIFKFFNQDNYYRILSFLIVIDKVKKRDEYFLSSDFQLKNSIEILQLVEEAFFSRKEENFIIFLQYLYKSWIVFAIDDSGARTTRDLEKRMVDTERSFSTAYEKNRKMIEDIIVEPYKEERKISISAIPQLEGEYEFPSYKDYFLPSEGEPFWPILRELIFTSYMILMLDYQLAAYVPYVLLKTKNNVSQVPSC